MSTSQGNFLDPAPQAVPWRYSIQANGVSLATYLGDVQVNGVVTYDQIATNRIIEEATVSTVPAAWSGGRRSYNIFNQSIQNLVLDAGAGFYIGAETSVFFKNIDGGVVAGYDFIAPLAANTNLHNQFYVARTSVAYCGYNMGGTGTTFALGKGDWFPLGPIVVLAAGATNQRSAGSEMDTVVHVGASVAMLYGWNVVGFNASRGADYDFAYGVGGAQEGDAIHIGWNYWHLAHDRNGLNPFHAGTTIMGFDWRVLTGSKTVANGIDFLGADADHRLLFTGYAFRSTGFDVDGSGNVRGKNIWRVQDTLNVAIDNTGSITENIVKRVTIPGGTLGANGILRIWPLWTMTNNANNKTERVYIGAAGAAIGASTLVDQVVLTANSSYERLLQIMNVNNQAVQKFPSIGNAGTGLGGGAAGLSAAAINTANDFDIIFTAQCANAADHLALESYVIEVFAK